MTAAQAYEKLVQRSREITLLSSTAAMLSWDEETYLPAKGIIYRAEQMAYLASQIHKLATEPALGEWLQACEEDKRMKPAQQANLREWRRDYDRQTKTPADLVEEMARTTSLSREAWQEARTRSDFSFFQPWLEKVIALNRRQADCWGWKKSRYDALLDYYEPGANSEDLTILLGNLRKTLVDLLPVAQKKTASKKTLEGNYPIEKQQAFNREVLSEIGFDFDSGRIDSTAHPFCTGMGPHDCRLTTRYDETDFTYSFFSLMHEMGHGLYEQGLREDAFGTPLGEALSLGIHESQSRLWENQVGRSKLFWEHWYPRAQHYFPSLKEISIDEFWKLINRVEPSFIRTESDEVTYNLHILLRFDLEKRLIEGDLPITEVPKAWNQEFKELFGLKVPDDAKGCLQDIHWSHGTFGYFPTYTLGNLNAAQLFHSAHAQLSELDQEIAKGSCGNLLRWLREKVHRYGKQYSSNELIKKATGEPTEAHYLGDYLRAKFSA